MEFTFGIITAGGQDTYIQKTVESIRAESIPKYEIIIVGDTAVRGDDITNIPFDETVKAGWLNKKKNTILFNAKYENVVLLHDYVALNKGWYEGFLKFGNNFDICVTKIIDISGNRYLDLLLFDTFHTLNLGFGNLLPYNYSLPDRLNKLLYVTGSYFILKKSIGTKYPLDESLCHNMGEDVVMCQTWALNNFKMKMNPYSEVKLLKDKFSLNVEIGAEQLERLLSLDDDEIDFLFERACHLQQKFIISRKQSQYGTNVDSQ